MSSLNGHILGVVPARSGSRGIPGKNLRPLAGKPLLAYAAEAARQSGVIDRVVLSTDAEEIAKVGREVGLEVLFLRPPELATDETPMQPTVAHAVAQVEATGWSPEVIVLLQPTAPLRRGDHIARAVELLAETGASSVVSVVEIPQHFNPQYAMKIARGRLEPYLPEGRSVARRQDVEPAYSRDGTVYVVRRDVVMHENDLYGSDCRPIVLSAHESLNIDTDEDWAAAELRLRA